MEEMGLVGGNGTKIGGRGEERVFLFLPLSFLSLVRFFSFLVSQSSSWVFKSLVLLFFLLGILGGVRLRFKRKLFRVDLW